MLVPFGRREVVGLVMGVSEESRVSPKRLRRAEALLDDRALLSDEVLWLIRFGSDYYHHPIGEVAAAALPVLLRRGNALYPELEFVAIGEADADLDTLAKRAPKQAELLVLLADAGDHGIDADSLTEVLPNWRRTAKPLLEKGLIRRFTARADDLEPVLDLEPKDGPTLNQCQLDALAAIRSSPGFAAYLLDGVTGSGKTEVYLHLIDEVLGSGRQALVLVPEIGLTPQLVSRFRSRLGHAPAVLHSGLSEVQRLSAWRRARSGEARLIVGTRSAIFTPLPNAGLIVVDEEHDHSFKQQEGLRYSARDLAVARAKHADIAVVLGTATPTMELLKHCRDRKYVHLALPYRAGGARPPDIRIVDLGRTPVVDGISDVLAAATYRGSGRCRLVEIVQVRSWSIPPTPRSRTSFCDIPVRMAYVIQ